LERVPDHVLVILDEAYFEYVDHPDYPNGLDYVRAGRNVVVFRTFSKAYGLAGLRIGYAMGRPELLDPVERVREPFNVNALAQVAAAAALSDQAHVARTRTLNREGLRMFSEACERLGLRYVPSQANFLLIEVGEQCAQVQQRLLQRGILVRTGEVFGMPTYLRVNTGTPEQNARFVEALADALRE
jgi:histidinol-phosphate aminotransferase